jgi:uncharacterized protein YcaQ
MINFSAEQVRWFRLRRSGLVEPFASPETAASSLAGIQAQILPAAAVALWNRTTGLTYDAFDSLLHQERTLVKLWGQRGTLHLYPSAEWPLIHSALISRPGWWEWRAAQWGLSTADYRALIERVADLLRQRQTLGRSDLRAADIDLHEAFFSSWGGIFSDLVRYGYACHAGQVGNEGRFAHREYWLPDLAWQPPPGEEANITLLRRYLRAYGPATLHDFAYWRYARMADARRWLALLADEVVEVLVAGTSMLALREDVAALQVEPPSAAAWPVRLLYRFDPLLLAHKDKSWLIDMAYYKRVWQAAGHIEGVTLQHGRITGAWRYDRKGGGLVITVYPFGKVTKKTQTAVRRHAKGVARFFGLPLVAVNYE